MSFASLNNKFASVNKWVCLNEEPVSDDDHKPCRYKQIMSFNNRFQREDPTNETAISVFSLNSK